jgi:hypothetical protein
MYLSYGNTLVVSQNNQLRRCGRANRPPTGLAPAVGVIHARPGINLHSHPDIVYTPVLLSFPVSVEMRYCPVPVGEIQSSEDTHSIAVERLSLRRLLPSQG